jgi:hypothetical protein
MHRARHTQSVRCIHVGVLLQCLGYLPCRLRRQNTPVNIVQPLLQTHNTHNTYTHTHIHSLKSLSLRCLMPAQHTQAYTLTQIPVTALPDARHERLHQAWPARRPVMSCDCCNCRGDCGAHTWLLVRESTWKLRTEHSFIGIRRLRPHITALTIGPVTADILLQQHSGELAERIGHTSSGLRQCNLQ